MAVTEEECCSSAKARSSQSWVSSTNSNSNGAHYLAKCVVKGSAVHQVLYGHIRSLSSLDIVLGKETSLELVIIGEDGTMQSVCDQAVFGTLKDLAILRWNAKSHEKNSQMSGKDLLVVLSDSGKLSFLTFCTEMHRFFPVTHVHLSNPGNSINQLGRMLAIDSSGCFVAVCAYDVRLALFSISTTASSDIIDNRITYPTEIEGDTKACICGIIWSMCFISRVMSQPCKDRSPVLAIIINRKGAVLSELLLLKWNIENHCVSVISQYAEAGPLAQHIVEVPHFHGFAFVFRLGEAHLMDLRDANNPSCVYKRSLTFLPPAVEERNYGDDSCRPHEVDEEKMFNVAARALLELSDYGTDMSRDDDPMNIDGFGEDVKPGFQHVCSWCWEPGNDRNPRMIFCLDTGGIYMIEVSFDFHELKFVLSECLYKCQPCSALLWAECGYVAAFVEMGDGMILKFEDEKLVNVSPIQNIAPILDMSVIDYNDEKHDQILACCGVASEGSLRLIRSGITVDKLLRTAPVYDGIIGTWTIKMKQSDIYHSFLVLSFFWEKTRVLLVGLSFSDVTDSIGFQSDVSTLACGLVNDSLLVQIHPRSVRLCLPTKAAHPDGIPLSSPICTSWSPVNNSISLGAVGHNMIVVATKNPCFLFILGVRLVSAHHYEIHEMQRVPLQNELSCISIPRMHSQQRPSTSLRNNEDVCNARPVGFEIGTTFVIGTHKPSVEVLSFLPDGSLRVIAIGTIPFIDTLDTTISDWNPIDVRLAFSDRLFILSGLRNGMMIRFDWPTSLIDENNAFSTMQPSKFVRYLMNDPPPTCLQLISMRRIGIKPVFLIPLSDSLEADIIALSDRPWLLHAARRCLSYTSISVQPSTHVTSVRSMECPEGVLFVTDNSLQLVEMVHNKRLNVQKLYLGGTPRKVLYHSESRLLLVMRNNLDGESFSSDVCFMDPLTGSVHSSFKLEHGEMGKSMELIRVENEQVLVIGTGTCSGPAIMPSGEAESSKGRLIVLCLEHIQNSDSGSMTFSSKPSVSSQRTSPFSEIPSFAAEQFSSSSLCSSPDEGSCDGIKLEETEPWQLRVTYSTTLPGMVVAICQYLDRYFLVSAGNAFYIFGFPYYDNPQRRFAAKRLAVGRTRYMVVSLTAHSTRIAVGDCRDGIIFYSYDEEARKLEQQYCDPSQRLTADCILMAEDTTVVTDRKGSIAVLSCPSPVEENATPESNLTLNCAYYMGEVAMSIRKISLLHKHPANGVLKGCDGSTNTIIDSSRKNIVAGTLSGSIMIFIPLLRDEYEILEAVQARLVVHPLTAPLLGNDHLEFRSRENPARVSNMLDGDMLCQFLELTNLQQEAIVELPLGSTNEVTLNSKPPLPISVSRVVQLLERVHYALN